MIKSLCIRNLATIEKIELDLSSGFSVLTGETGAGKSIIIDGIRLITGGKGSPDMIRTGEKQTSVEAVFQALSESSSSEEEEETLLQRIQTEKGSGRGFYNGQMIPVKTMREYGEELVDIYGQNDHVFLRKPANQLDYLDSYAEAIPIREKVAGSAQNLRKLIRLKSDLESRESDRVQRQDYLHYMIKEIEDAELQPAEDTRLIQERHILKNTEKIAGLITESLEISYLNEHSISSQLSRLLHITQELSEFDKTFKETYSSLDQLSIAVQEFSEFLRGFKENQSSSPEKLESIEGRLSRLEALKRKYGQSIDEILEKLELSRKELQELESNQEKIEELAGKIEEQFEEYKFLTGQLLILRKERALELENAIEEEIGYLGMEKAQVKIVLNSHWKDLDLNGKIKDSGTEDIEFMISPNPGEEVKPLRKIASGGELSRIMLALKSIGKENDTFKTLIFDEIDAGIGGKVADFIAQKLKRLSQINQVICITHLPQIASFAEHHYRIDKHVREERTYTTIRRLSFSERVEEVARLISGTLITETALKNAREMLEQNASIED